MASLHQGSGVVCGLNARQQTTICLVEAHQPTWWTSAASGSVDGTLLLLRRLASSPLVRKTLPNTAAITQQYVDFKTLREKAGREHGHLSRQRDPWL